MAPKKSKDGRGGARPGTGPKPLPLTKRRRNRIVLNLTDTEYRQVEKAARGKHLGSFAREIVLRSVARRR